MNKDTLFVVYVYTVKIVFILFKDVKTLFVDWLTGAGIEPGPRKEGPITLHSSHSGLNLL